MSECGRGAALLPALTGPTEPVPLPGDPALGVRRLMAFTTQPATHSGHCGRGLSGFSPQHRPTWAGGLACGGAPRGGSGRAEQRPESQPRALVPRWCPARGESSLTFRAGNLHVPAPSARAVHSSVWGPSSLSSSVIALQSGAFPVLVPHLPRSPGLPAPRLLSSAWRPRVSLSFPPSIPPHSVSSAWGIPQGMVLRVLFLPRPGPVS